MGEYGTYNGDRIKIGTCEDMLYLRPDQIPLVRSSTLDHVTSLRFRFPFPYEDKVEPGHFDDPFRGHAVYVLPPDGVDHHDVQFKDTYGAGVLVMLPCEFSAEGKRSGIKYMHNGYVGPSHIVQQRVWNGVWVTVMRCGNCRTLWRLETLADAEPVIEALIAKGDRESKEIALRIGAGYTTPYEGK